MNGLSVALFSTNGEFRFRVSFFLFIVLIVYRFYIIDYKFGIKLFRTQEKLFVINFNAKNQHDQLLFYKDLKEAIAEVIK